jgi:hypothetical protein
VPGWPHVRGTDSRAFGCWRLTERLQGW